MPNHPESQVPMTSASVTCEVLDEDHAPRGPSTGASVGLTLPSNRKQSNIPDVALASGIGACAGFGTSPMFLACFTALQGVVYSLPEACRQFHDQEADPLYGAEKGHSAEVAQAPSRQKPPNYMRANLPL